MKKLIILLLGVCLLLGACSQYVPQQAPTPEPEVTSAPTEAPFVDIGGTELDVQASTLDLSAVPYEMEKLLAAAPRLSALREIELGATTLTAEQVEALRAAFPGAALHYRVSLFGESYEPETERLALPDMDPADSAALAAALPLLTGLREIDFTSPDGACAYTIEDLPQLDLIRAAAPGVRLKLSFELFGQTVTSEDERIEYLCVPIGNEGAETVRAVLPYLTGCEYLLLDGCGIDNEVMAQLRDDFPETKIVWRVWLVEPDYRSARLLRTGSYLTDTYRIRTILVNDNNCQVLKYCTETKYVDFGHNENISDFSFLACMPKLEVAIIGLSHCKDLTPLENCPELEYLECYGCDVTDLSPLRYCTKLKHLNCSRTSISDLTPIFDLDLERLRCVVTDVPKEQLEEYAALHPDCEMLLAGWAPHENGWRYDSQDRMVPRYALLREQMEYDIDREVYGIQ